MSVLALAVSAALLCSCSKGTNTGSETASDSSGTANEESGAVTDHKGIVTMGQYKGLELTASLVEYDDDEIEIQTKQMYFYYIQAEDGITDRPVENLDMTNIDYEGKKDGVAFEGGTAQGATLLIGSGQFIAGFEEGLIGVMPGETVDLNLTFPDWYGNAELAGQEVVFTVTVNFIPEMEDGRVSEIGIPDVTTVEELRAYVKENMEAQAKNDYLNAADDELMTKVIEGTVFGELPEDMMAENRETYSTWLDQQAAAYGLSAKDYVEMGGKDYETILDEYAERYTKILLVVHSIADIEGLNISDEALDAQLEEYAQTRGVAVDDLLVNGLTKEDYRESFLYENVLNFLVDNSVSVSSIVD